MSLDIFRPTNRKVSNSTARLEIELSWPKILKVQSREEDMVETTRNDGRGTLLTTTGAWDEIAE